MSNTFTKKVPYVRLGNSGLKVSRVILGTMGYGSREWQDWSKGEDEATEHIKAAYEAGIQTFDTADVYSNGMSEVILGNAIKKLDLPRDEIVILTKVFFAVSTSMSENTIAIEDPDQAGFANQWGLSRKHIFDSVKASLKRLQLDYIDVLQCHRFDYNTPIEETMHALHDVVKAGYVRYIGMSSCYAYQFSIMQNYARTHGLTEFISMQNHYSLIYREEEREMFPTLKHFNVGAIPWSPLARGLLTRPLSAQTTRGETDWFMQDVSAESKAIIDRVEEVAKKKGVSMAQVSLAWILSHPGVSAPVIGTSSVQRLHDTIAGLDVKLSDEELKYLGEPYVPMAIRGHF